MTIRKGATITASSKQKLNLKVRWNCLEQELKNGHRVHKYDVEKS